MDNQLHTAGERAGSPFRKSARRRAGLPAKRFFTRYTGLSDVPAAELELLALNLRSALELDPGSPAAATPIPGLHALVRQEIDRRRDEPAG